MIYSVVNNYISDSKIPNAGRGVLAKINIKKGELIESCPVIQIPSNEASFINKSILVNYIYYLGKNKNKLTLVLGFGSIYNHSYSPNARYRKKQNEKTVDFIATQNIKKGEEITVNYKQGSLDKTPLWFE